MKIIFICGSVEPGRDGVGDYTRILAANIKKKGGSVKIIALYDKAIFSPVSEKQTQDGEVIDVLRIPYSASIKLRYSKLSEFVTEDRPDWVSVQYVPYSYNNKGLNFGMPFLLFLCFYRSRFHVMFHETWIGFSAIASFRHRLIGALQKLMARLLLTVLRPKVMHTSNHLYRLMLQELNVEAKILPIFSNINVHKDKSEWITTVLQDIGITPDSRPNWVITGVFGTVHPDFDPIPHLRALVDENNQKRLAFFGIGRSGQYWLALLERIKEEMGDVLCITHFGEQSETHISQFLSVLDYGIATMPMEFINKSGTVAAMRAHGVKVIVTGAADFPEYSARLGAIDSHELPLNLESFTSAAICRQFLSHLLNFNDSIN